MARCGRIWLHDCGVSIAPFSCLLRAVLYIQWVIIGGYSVRYYRLSRLLEQMHLARADGSFLRLLKTIARTDLLLIDDWGLARLSHPQQTDILELLDDRHQQRSTMITSQLPVDAWHQSMADPTLADAILDRLVHTAHIINLTSDSLRKLSAITTDSDHFCK